MNRKILTPILIITLLVVGWSILSTNKEGEQKPENISKVSTQQTQEPADDRPNLVIGNKDAKVTLYEYGDYKCPSCGKFHQEAEKDIMKNYVDTGKVKIVFRTYPYIGPDSGKAVRGAYCANDQGKFPGYHSAVFDFIWDKHYANGDYKYEIEEVFSVDVLTDLAAKQGIDSEKFRTCITSDTFNKYVDADLYLAADDNVQGTPTFVIAGQNIVGPQPYAVFKSLLDIQLR